MAMRLAKLLRGTPAEHALEPAVAALGVPYRVQFDMWQYAGGLRYFPDFVLPTLSLVIEVDDRSHRHKVEEDAERTEEIAEVHGWRVLRCTNEEAIHDPIGTVNRLMETAGLANRVSRETEIPRGRWLPLPARAAGTRPTRRRSRTSERGAPNPPFPVRPAGTGSTATS